MAKTKQVLLIDGDIVAFNSIVASLHELELVDGEGHVFYHNMTDFTTAYNIATAQIEAIRQACGGGTVIFTWTDYTSNWRTDVLPSYKSHRRKADSIRPAGLIPLKEKLAEDYESYCWPSLEADDVMGILATDDDFYAGFKKIIVSEDKDMKTIPAWIYNPAKDYQPWLNEEAEADLYFLSQALGGDVTDGYSG
uniref:hypothetical protein n=1 Tax=Endozoicomonas sp. SESOKO1 TaxID=2828742 RepID=UPI0021496D48